MAGSAACCTGCGALADTKDPLQHKRRYAARHTCLTGKLAGTNRHDPPERRLLCGQLQPSQPDMALAACSLGGGADIRTATLAYHSTSTFLDSCASHEHSGRLHNHPTRPKL